MKTPSNSREAVRRSVESEIEAYLVDLGHASLADCIASGKHRAADDADTVGRRIRNARHKAKMTCVALAAAVGVQKQQIHRWERGSSAPTIERLGTIAGALGTTARRLTPNT